MELKEREIALKEREALAEASVEMFNAETERLQTVGVIDPSEHARQLQEVFNRFADVVNTKPKTQVGRIKRLPDGSYEMIKQDIEE